MNLDEVVRRRRMVRDYDARPVATDVVDRLLDAARRGPSAGNSQGLDLVVLEGPDETARYWDVTLADAGARARFRWQGLLRAPVLVVPVVAASAYTDRYTEADKAAAGLTSERAWTVPYWYVDGGMGVLLLLLAAVDEGLGASFFGVFDHEAAVRSALGVPDDRRLLGAVALGHPAPGEPGRSATRPRRSFDDVVHRGGW